VHTPRLRPFAGTTDASRPVLRRSGATAAGPEGRATL